MPLQITAKGDEPPSEQQTIAARPSPRAGTAAVPRPGGMHRSYAPASLVTRRWRAVYLSPITKFALACTFAAAWVGVSIWISLPWIHDLARHISIVPAAVLVTLFAFLPGYLIAFLTAGAILDRQPALVAAWPTAPVTVLIAARNEYS